MTDAVVRRGSADWESSDSGMADTAMALKRQQSYGLETLTHRRFLGIDVEPIISPVALTVRPRLDRLRANPRHRNYAAYSIGGIIGIVRLVAASSRCS